MWPKLDKVAMNTSHPALDLDLDLDIDLDIDIDIDVDIDLVDPETYLHRVGRTGRFGSRGVAIRHDPDPNPSTTLA